MFARAYLVGGVMLLVVLALMMFMGWEFGSAVRGSAPPPGAVLRASRSGSWSGSHSSSSHSGWWIFIGK